MIKELHGLIRHAFYLFAELCRFTPRYLCRHLVELVEAVSHNRPKLIFCIVGNDSCGTHATCAFPLLSNNGVPARVWNEI
jgi:hypothetical protein